MKATPSGFGRGLVIAFVASIAIGGYLYRHFGLGNPGKPKQLTPATLVRQAKDALEAVKNRDLETTLRPAKYDDILRPLDQLLQIAKSNLESPDYDPEGSYEKIAASAGPVVDLAQQAHDQAQRETTFLKKDYRFLEQKGDACRYQAAALWNKLEAENTRKQANYMGSAPPAFVPSFQDSEQLYSWLDAGIAAAPDNKFLWYLRSVVRRSNGAFGEAEKDLRRALELDGDFVAAWNDLGLVLVNLKRFDQAEQAFVKAKDRAAQEAKIANVQKGDDYIAALFNLANLHQALAAYYARSERQEPSAENKASLARHVKGTREALSEIFSAVPDNSPYVREAKRLESELP